MKGANMQRRAFQARARILWPMSFVLLLAACAVGNRYDYRGAIAGLPVTGTGTIAVDVIDARPYVENGKKKPDFIGLQRGGFGNPFDVTTTSGHPLAQDMREAIASALQKQGYVVVGARDVAPRKLELRVQEWKSDVMMRISVAYDLVLSVYDGQGALLAKSAAKGTDVQGGGFESQNATSAARTFESRFTELIRDDAVHKALSAAQ
jgi:hypothetical protein